METPISRKTLTDPRDIRAAEGAEEYIGKLPNGAGTWSDESMINPPIMPGVTLVIRDKYDGDDRNLRHVQVWLGSHLVVTLVYDHRSHQLVRTF